MGNDIALEHREVPVGFNVMVARCIGHRAPVLAKRRHIASFFLGILKKN